MRTLFEVAPFARDPWAPARTLGVTAEEIFGELVEAAPEAYEAYQAKERAEEDRKKAEAQAAAAAAQAQTAQAAAAAAQAQAGAGKILGVPTGYLVVGGLALAAVGIIIAVTKG